MMFPYGFGGIFGGLFLGGYVATAFGQHFGLEMIGFAGVFTCFTTAMVCSTGTFGIMWQFVGFLWGMCDGVTSTVMYAFLAKQFEGPAPFTIFTLMRNSTTFLASFMIAYILFSVKASVG